MPDDMDFEFRMFLFGDSRVYVTHWIHRSVRSAIKAGKMMACDERFEIWRAGQCIYRHPARL